MQDLPTQPDTHNTSDKAYIHLLSATIFAAFVIIVMLLFSTLFTSKALINTQPITFDGHIYDPAGNLTTTDILPSVWGKPDLMHDYEVDSIATKGQHWLWLPLDQIQQDLDILRIELAWLDRISLHFVTATGKRLSFKAGDNDRFDERVIPFRKPILPIVREINDEAVEWIVVQISAQGRLSLPLLATSEKAFNSSANLDYFFYGAWIAILAALSFYNMTLFFSLRDDIYFYYIAYVFSFFALLIVANGLGQQYLWPSSANTTTSLAHISLALTNAGTSFFVVKFISLFKHSRRLALAILGFAWFSLICAPLTYLLSYSLLAPIFISSFVVMGLCLIAAIYTSLQGDRLAPFMVSSLLILIPCNSIGLLRFLGFWEDAYWGEHVAELGIAVEALILSIGLAYRVNLLRLEKDEALIARAAEQITFTRQLISTKEQERRSIGKALHDSLGHKIIAIKSAVETLGNARNRSSDQRDTLEMLDEAIEEVRDLSHLLYPSILEHMGLEKAVRSMVSKALDRADINYSVNISTRKLAPALGIFLYRAAQECVSNLLKHSNGNEFSLSIISSNNCDSSLRFCARDNGSDILAEENFGYGLTMLKQHASTLNGELNIDRTPDGYNQIIVDFS